MIRDTFFLRFISNFLLISSVMIVDDCVPWVSLPKAVKFKKNKNLKDGMDVQDMEEV